MFSGRIFFLALNSGGCRGAIFNCCGSHKYAWLSSFSPLKNFNLFINDSFSVPLNRLWTKVNLNTDQLHKHRVHHRTNELQPDFVLREKRERLIIVREKETEQTARGRSPDCSRKHSETAKHRSLVCTTLETEALEREGDCTGLTGERQATALGQPQCFQLSFSLNLVVPVYLSWFNWWRERGHCFALIGGRTKRWHRLLGRQRVSTKGKLNERRSLHWVNSRTKWKTALVYLKDSTPLV